MTDDTETTKSTVEQHDATLPAPAREGLHEATIPLATTDPAGARDDLTPIGDQLSQASVVGLGEATHGTREFFELKHRLLRHLVVDHGARAFAMEASLPEAIGLHDYVVHGEGDARACLDAINLWPWQVDSVLALLEWLRSFNDGRPREDRVECHGFASHSTHGAVQRLRDHLDAVDPALLADVADELATIDDEREAMDAVDDVDERVAAAERVVPALRDHLDEHRAEHVAATSERAWARARRYAAILEQVVEKTAALAAHDGPVGATEDDDPSARLLGLPGSHMADNVAWIRDRVAADTLVLWAHDAHLNRVAYPFQGTDASAPSLGRHLADHHGDDYYALGFSFASGAFRAADATADDPAPREHHLDGPLEGTLDAALHALEEPLAFVDFRAAREDDRAADWLAAPQPKFATGGTYDSTAPRDHLVEFAPADAFDALCFVAATTPARPLDGLANATDDEDATDER